MACDAASEPVSPGRAHRADAGTMGGLCISHENDDTNDALYMNIAFTEGLEKNIMTL